MRRTACLLSLLLVLAACGGGGAATLPADDTVDQSPQLITDILTACDVGDVGQALTIQDLLLDLLGPGATPDFAITGINIIQASFSWSLDLDATPPAEILGTTQFKDASGNPTIPLANIQDLLDVLAGDLSALGALLASLPEGTQITTTYQGSPAQLPSTTIQGAITLVVGAGGTLGSSSGSYGSQTGTACSSDILWNDLDLSTIATGGYPSGTMQVTASGPDNDLDGTLTLDGDATAELEVSVDGGTPVTYTFDLTTGQVSTP